jgi:DNA-binding CsgD family transcriptional regulator
VNQDKNGNDMTRKRGRPPFADLLTPAEWRVLHATRHGMSNKVMAQRMGVSINAIKYHLGNILVKTGASNKKILRTFTTQPQSLTARITNDRSTSMTETAKPGTIGQIARTVKDINVSTNWYELVLELPHLYSFGDMAFFDCNGTRLMLTQDQKFNPAESILYFKVDDIVETHAVLAEKDVEFIAAPHRIHTHEDGTEEWMAFFNDPDDRLLAIMSTVA